MKFLITSIFLLCSCLAHAGYVAKDSKITHVSNVASNTSTKFAIKISGGTTNCSGTWIMFDSANMGGTDGNTNMGTEGSGDSLSRAYSTVLTAFASDSYVTIYDYDESNSNTDCSNAGSIQIHK